MGVLTREEEILEISFSGWNAAWCFIQDTF